MTQDEHPVYTILPVTAFFFINYITLR